jgi:LPS export ABC transporter protein LptC
MSARTIIAVVVLALGAMASWYLAKPDSSHDVDSPPYDELHRGYYLKSVKILGTGSDGRSLYEIEASYAEQQDDQSISLTEVRIIYTPRTDVPWTVDADTATISQVEQRVLLRGHVRAVSSAGFSGGETEIRTQYLELDPESFLAETDQRVQIRIGARSLTATGMLASLKENRLELKSNVSGKFAP